MSKRKKPTEDLSIYGFAATVSPEAGALVCIVRLADFHVNERLPESSLRLSNLPEGLVEDEPGIYTSKRYTDVDELEEMMARLGYVYSPNLALHMNLWF